MNPNRNKKRVLIVTALAGYGHLSSASALEYWLEEWGYNPLVVTVGDSSLQENYELFVKHPLTWRSLFKISDVTKVTNLLVSGFSKTEEKKLMSVLLDYPEFDLIVSNYPLFHPKKGKRNLIILPDPVAHSSYFAKPYPNKYFSFWKSAELNAPRKVKRNVPIVTTGPLSRKAFYERAEEMLNGRDKNYYKEKLGLDINKKYCLVMAGGHWISKSKAYLQFFKDYAEEMNTRFVVVCGKDTSFYNKMISKYGDDNNFIIHSWVEQEEMSYWMSACDYSAYFSIAQSCVEAGLCRLPIFLFSFIPGQESMYKDVLIEKNTGVYLTGTKAEKVEKFFYSIRNLAGYIPSETMVSWQKELLESKDKFRDSLDSIINSHVG